LVFPPSAAAYHHNPSRLGRVCCSLIRRFQMLESAVDQEE
jgi:hypothetical protein